MSVQTLNQWKKKFLENAALAFDVGGATKEYRDRIEKLEKENEALAKTLGKTTIERDWAVGKLKSLDLSSKRSLVGSRLENLSVTRQCELIVHITEHPDTKRGNIRTPGEGIFSVRPL